jgi:hypothetical protein
MATASGQEGDEVSFWQRRPEDRLRRARIKSSCGLPRLTLAQNVRLNSLTGPVGCGSDGREAAVTRSAYVLPALIKVTWF